VFRENHQNFEEAMNPPAFFVVFTHLIHPKTERFRRTARDEIRDFIQPL
jgi:hypothetical protein